MATKSKTTSAPIESASKYLAKILRHNGSDHPAVDSRGWCNLKDVRLQMQSKFPDYNPLNLLELILEADNMNRFQIQTADDTSFIRATRDHTRPEVDLIDPDPEEDELNWYLYQSYSSFDSAWVEATSAEVASKLLNRRSNIPHILQNSAKICKPDEFTETDRDDIFESTLKSGIKDEQKPRVKVHQSASKYLSVDARSNMSGYKGIYTMNHPKRTRDRIP